MKREIVTPRADWRARHEALRFDAVEALNGTDYWTEDACYRFTAAQIDVVEDATQRLHDMCLEAVERAVSGGDWYERLRIPDWMVAYIETTWRRDDPSIYGRFDLAWNGDGAPKMLEYNADTPTALYEAAVLQWHWLKDRQLPDQFNFIHEQLIESWAAIRDRTQIPALHFACDFDSAEDALTTAYLRDTASQGGFVTRAVAMEDIGFDEQARVFVDGEDQTIAALFKLYPWEFMAIEPFGQIIPEDIAGFMEPAWKMILSNKGVLALLWEMFPDHKNLLPAALTEGVIKGPHVIKPLYSREGANIRIRGAQADTDTDGAYGDGPAVWQAYAPLPVFDGKHAVIGSWVVGGTACGMGIREDAGMVTTNSARFVPHYFTDK